MDTTPLTGNKWIGFEGYTKSIRTILTGWAHQNIQIKIYYVADTTDVDHLVAASTLVESQCMSRRSALWNQLHYVCDNIVNRRHSPAIYNFVINSKQKQNGKIQKVDF